MFRRKLLTTIIAITLFSVAAHAAEVRVDVMGHDGKPIKDAVAYLVSDTVEYPPVPEPEEAPVGIMDQVDKQFVPRVLAIRTGSIVRFPNRDDILHHVYSFSDAKQFELPLYKAGKNPEIVFDTPGAAVLGCNIHDWMIGYIYITDSPWFAISSEDGEAVIHNVPAGKFTAKIWHPELDTDEEPPAHEISVEESGETKLMVHAKLLEKHIHEHNVPVLPGGMDY